MGEMMSGEFDAFDAELGQLEWYLFPHEIQRLFIVSIANAQHPTNIQGYGQILCVRETVKKVSECRFFLCGREVLLLFISVIFRQRKQVSHTSWHFVV